MRVVVEEWREMELFECNKNVFMVSIVMYN